MCADSLHLTMMPEAHSGEGPWALLVLLDDEREARALSRFLEGLRDPDSVAAADILVPPVRGIDFFADDSRQHDLDVWWSRHVPRSATPVYLLLDVTGLEEWLAAVDGDVYVGVADAHRMAAYATFPSPRRSRVHPFLCDGPLDLAAVVMHDLSPACGSEATLFGSANALRAAALSRRFPLRSIGASASDFPAGSVSNPSFAKPPRDVEAPGSASDQRQDEPGPAARPNLSDEQLPGRGPIVSASASAPGSARLPSQLSTRRAAHWVRRLLGREEYRPRPDAELAHQLAARGPTIVVTGSRKGGVGKTSFAAGISVTAGGILDQIGHRACIVDANIANPDAWGELHLPDGAATVRELIAALLANREPPPPVHAAIPGLACYPEVREPTEYSRTAIRALADYLRRRYTFTVVDMSNRLPDPTAGPEAAVAAYWLEAADVLVLPTTSARADFNGALDYLEIAGLPPTLVPYIVAADRRLRDNPTTLEYLKAIRRRAHSVVEIADEANVVRLAGMEGVPAEHLSVRLRLGYRRLTEAIADMPRRGS